MSLSSRVAKLIRNRAGFSFIDHHVAVSTSIYGEDLLVERLLHPGATGTYVDVGANHPIEGSNTYRLYLKGWSGLAIDPNPKFADSFRKLRSRDKHLAIGVSPEPATLTYFEFGADNLNTLSPKRAADLVSQGEHIVRQTPVKTAPLRMIVDRYLPGRPIDLLNVDVEGLDLEVLMSLDLTVNRPSVMIVEDYGRYISFMKGGHATPFETFLRDNGYRPIAQTAWSCILVGEDWRALFARTEAFAEGRVQNSYMPGQFYALPWAGSV